MSNPIGEYLKLVTKQKRFLDNCQECDDFYGDRSPEELKRRSKASRGWTRQDINRRKYILRVSDEADEALAKGVPPSVSLIKPDGRISTRIETAFKVFTMEKAVVAACDFALRFCHDNPEYFLREPSLIHELHRWHTKLLRAIREDDFQLILATKEEWLDAVRLLRDADALIASMPVSQSHKPGSPDKNPSEGAKKIALRK